MRSSARPCVIAAARSSARSLLVARSLGAAARASARPASVEGDGQDHRHASSFRGNRKAEDDAIRRRPHARSRATSSSAEQAARRHPRRSGRWATSRTSRSRRPTRRAARSTSPSCCARSRPSARSTSPAPARSASTRSTRSSTSRRTPSSTRPRSSATSRRSRDLYVEKGYYLAEVSSDIQRKDENHVDVYFNVDEHAKVEVRQIRFLGNQHVTDAELKGGDGHAGGRLAVVPHLVGHLPRGRVRPRPAAASPRSTTTAATST